MSATIRAAGGRPRVQDGTNDDMEIFLMHARHCFLLGRATRIRIAGLAALAATILLLRPAAPDARTLHVLPDGSGDAPTIQAGVDSAAAGDTVLVHEGTYTDVHEDALGDFSAVEMKSGVVVRSAAGPEATHIDLSAAPSPSRGFLCLDCAESTVIEGFTVTGGDAYFGAAILVSGGAPRITGNHLIEAYGGSGGAMAVTAASQAVVRENRFADNTACCGPGGALLIESSSQPLVTANEFTGNTGFNGGAVAVHQAGGQITGNHFEGNLGSQGGALSVFRGEVAIRGNRFADNQASSGGGAVYVHLTDTGTFLENLLHGNEASGNGGGILVEDSSPTFGNNTVTGNTAFSGAGIFIQGTSSPQLDHDLVAFNQGSGEVACQIPAQPSFHCCNVYALEGPAYAGDCTDPTGTNGNLSADPLFCAGGDGTLQACSPCAPAGACELIGARPVACPCEDPTPARTSSWGAIKTRFRNEAP